MRRLLASSLLLAAPALAAPVDGGAPTAATVASTQRWWRANFHAHAADTPGGLGDDGSESVAALHAAAERHGYDFSLHTPHSSHNDGVADAPARLARQRAIEAPLSVETRGPSRPFVVAVGQELSVATGPSYHQRNLVLGHDAPGNLDHATIVGAARYLPSGTRLADACRAAHESGGLCLVNHPGPGPLMWEPDLWEQPATRGLVDGIEVYNGQALAAVGIDFESRYLEATSYRGLGLHFAATTGADTHGPGSTQRARSNLDHMGAAAKLLAAMAPGPSPVGDGRDELDAATWLLAPSPSLGDVEAAVRARRTIASYRFDAGHVDCPGLGEVRPTGAVALRIAFGRKVSSVTLYREGTAVATWRDVDAAEWKETVKERTAYVWAARDGLGRMMTSGIWYEPSAPPSPPRR